MMQRIKWFLAVVLLSIADACGALAQQSPRPVMTMAATPNETKLDRSLPWISEYHPPFIYQLWWSEIADCEGLPLPADSLRKVQYYQVNAPVFIPQDVDAVVFAVTYEQNQTFVAQPYIWNKALVEHEALHLLRKWAGDPFWYDHNPRYYDKCGVPSSGQPPPNQ